MCPGPPLVLGGPRPQSCLHPSVTFTIDYKTMGHWTRPKVSAQLAPGHQRSASRQPGAAHTGHRRGKVSETLFLLSFLLKPERQGLGSGWLSHVDHVGVLAPTPTPGEQEGRQDPHMPMDVKGCSGVTTVQSAFWAPQSRGSSGPECGQGGVVEKVGL